MASEAPMTAVDNDNDDVFIKHAGLLRGFTLCGYEYKSHAVVVSSAAVVGSMISSIYYTFWLSRGSKPQARLPRSLSAKNEKSLGRPMSAVNTS